MATTPISSAPPGTVPLGGALDEARVLVLYAGRAAHGRPAEQGTIGMLSTDQGYAPHPNFLVHNLRSQGRFHDESLTSIFSNSSSVNSFTQWQTTSSSRPSSPVPRSHATPSLLSLPVQTSTGTRMLPSLVTPRSKEGKRIRYVVMEYEPLIDSAEVEMEDWVRIAGDVERNYASWDGFVVLHGTDTMAYTASALSFLLQDLGKTVILTGAQIPLSQLLNDSLDNLLGALILAGHYIIPEVGLFFHHKLYRGNRAKKVSSDGFAAFDTPGFTELAEVGIDIEINWPIVLRPSPRPFRAHKSLCPDITTIRIIPGLTGRSVRALLSPAAGIRGCVLESYGAGNAPTKEELLSAFREASARGVVIVNVTQCAEGAVAPGIYATGRALAAVGITPGSDMTTECALAKLSYLLSMPNLSPDEVRNLLSTPLRGELGVPAPPAPANLSRLLALLAEGATDTLSEGPTPTDTLLPHFPAAPADATALEAALLPHLIKNAAVKSATALKVLLETDGGVLPPLEEALMLAVRARMGDCVIVLVGKGASVHVRDEGGKSVLFYAARNADLETVRTLKGVGAHLAETEIVGGNVGLEALKGDRKIWEVAAGGEENLKRAVEVLRALVEAAQ